MNNKGGIIFKLFYTFFVLTAGIVFGVFLSFRAGDLILPLFSTSPSLSPPANYFDSGDIQVFNDKIILLVSNSSVTNYGASGSMLPTLNENSNGIAIVPKDDSEVKVGDIVSYRSSDASLIVHRVIEKNSDGGGVYLVVKGDNSDTTEIIRFSQIKHKIVGILY